MHASKNIRLFENPYLERLSYVHPVTPGLIFAPIAGYQLFLGVQVLSLSSILLAVFAGILIWSLTEYTLHRFLFHFKPVGPITERMAFIFHGIHHADPEDARRLVMPPTASIAFAVAFYALFKWGCIQVLGADMGSRWFHPFFAGFIIGYLWYDYTHFWVHFGTPKSKIGRYLKQYHMLHHYVTPEQRFGVSNPFWDHVVGTSASTSVRAKSAVPSKPRQA